MKNKFFIFYNTPLVNLLMLFCITSVSHLENWFIQSLYHILLALAIIIQLTLALTKGDVLALEMVVWKHLELAQRRNSHSQYSRIYAHIVILVAIALIWFIVDDCTRFGFLNPFNYAVNNAIHLLTLSCPS